MFPVGNGETNSLTWVVAENASFAAKKLPEKTVV